MVSLKPPQDPTTAAGTSTFTERLDSVESGQTAHEGRIDTLETDTAALDGRADVLELRTKTGSGSPEGAVTAGPGAIYAQTNGTTMLTLWVKDSGAGNTGWKRLRPETTIPIRYELFGPRPGDGLALSSGNGIGTSYSYLTALTANSMRLDSLVTAPNALEQAWVRFSWTPNDADCGIELLSFEGGPVNETQIVEFTGLTSSSPIVSTSNVTAAIQALLDNAAERFIGFRAKRDAAVNPHLYSAWLECVYRV